MTKQALPLLPIKDKIEILIKSIELTENYIKKRLFSIKKHDSQEYSKALKEIRDRLNNQRSFNRAWVTANTGEAYSQAEKKVLSALKKLGFSRPIKKSNRNTEIKNTSKAVDDIFNIAIDKIEERCNLFFKLLQEADRKLLQNLDSFSPAIRAGISLIKKISIIPAERTTKAGYKYIATPSRQEIQDQIEILFQETFGDFHFIQVNLKNGGTRNYSPAKYFKMVARTEMRYAQTAATKEQCRQYNCDLVQVSTHDSPCDICKEYEGKVYSLSGKSEKYPILDIDMPLHPNCEHGLNPVTEAYLNEGAT